MEEEGEEEEEEEGEERRVIVRVLPTQGGKWLGWPMLGLTPAAEKCSDMKTSKTV